MKRFFKKSPKLLLAALVGGVVGGLVVGGVVVAVGTARSATGSIATFNAVEVSHPQVSGDDVCTTSGTYEDIPGMSSTFTVGGLVGSAPAVVMYQAQIVDAGAGYFSGNANIRLLVDNNVQPGSGGEMPIQGSLAGFGTESWNFFTNSLSAGSHTAKLQWQVTDPSPDDGMPVRLCLQNRGMTVLHR